MRNLIAANLFRLRKSWVFRLGLIVSAGCGVFVAATCWLSFARGKFFPLDTIFPLSYAVSEYLPLPALMLALTTAFFLGGEHDSRAIRNKLTAGHTPAEVYLANLAACVLAGLMLDAAYLLTVTALTIVPILWGQGAPLGIPAWQMLLWLLAALTARCAQAAVMALIASLLGRRTAAAVGLLLAVAGMMYLCQYGFGEIWYWDFILAEPADLSPDFIREVTVLRNVFSSLAHTLPSGQLWLLGEVWFPTLWQLPLASLGVTAAAAGAGVALYRRKDWK